uniref:Glomulin, FKBP associated protein b n=1 Tax=Gadus morhua TaxID=8049 RepID=A0A8C4Z843_GADMO
SCIAQGDAAQLLTFLQDVRNKEIVQSMGCGLLAPLANEMTKKEKTLVQCEMAMTHLTMVAMYQPLPIKVIPLLCISSKVLLRMGEGRAASLDSALSSIQKQLSRLPVPYTTQLEESDQYGLCRSCSALTDFVKPFVEEVKGKYGKKSSQCLEDQELNDVLLKLQHIQISVIIQHFPRFILQSNMEYINLLLSRQELYARSLDSVEDGSLTVDLLELKTFYSVQQNLRHILIECPSQKLRERSLLVLQYFINKLNSKAKHRFFRCMLKTSQHSGIEGYIVKNIKNQVEFSMKPGNENEWFFGVEFIYLLEQALSLPQGAETYLLQNMDRIMEGLNLLRYLLIRDKEWKSKSAAVWEELCRIKDDHLKMMRLGITMSRTYYINEAKTLREDYKLKARGRNCLLTNILFNRGTFFFQVIQNALVSFDLMESLIFRIEEIKDEKAKSVN